MSAAQCNAQELELAWAAGLIDGEGCFTIGAKQGGASLRFRIFVVLEERDGFVLDKLHAMFGGVRHHRRRQKSWKPNCKEQEVWEARTLDDSLRIAKMLLPYLVLKQGTCASFIDRLEQYLATPRADGRPRVGYRR